MQNILLVDDEPSVLLALKLLLEALGYSVNDFQRGMAAIEYLRAGNLCDLILCDLKMPEMNGIEVLQEVQKLLPKVPFLLMSAHARDDDVRRAKSLGAAGFLAKPFTPDQLRGAISGLAIA